DARQLAVEADVAGRGRDRDGPGVAVDRDGARRRAHLDAARGARGLHGRGRRRDVQGAGGPGGPDGCAGGRRGDRDARADVPPPGVRARYAGADAVESSGSPVVPVARSAALSVDAVTVTPAPTCSRTTARSAVAAAVVSRLSEPSHPVEG